MYFKIRSEQKHSLDNVEHIKRQLQRLLQEMELVDTLTDTIMKVADVQCLLSVQDERDRAGMALIGVTANSTHHNAG